jgi:hypothetical protein
MPVSNENVASRANRTAQLRQPTHDHSSFGHQVTSSELVADPTILSVRRKQHRANLKNWLAISILFSLISAGFLLLFGAFWLYYGLKYALWGNWYLIIWILFCLILLITAFSSIRRYIQLKALLKEEEIAESTSTTSMTTSSVTTVTSGEANATINLGNTAPFSSFSSSVPNNNTYDPQSSHGISDSTQGVWVADFSQESNENANYQRTRDTAYTK